MSQLQNIFKNITAQLGRLSFNQKIAIGTLILGSVAVTTMFFQHGQSDFDIMFSGLDESDAAAVVQNLRHQGIPFRLADNGTTIMVPHNQKEELRLGAFKDDLIKSDKTIGFDALSSLPFGLTSWQEEKYDQKMMSDEVVKTLERIEGIKKARVLLAQPKNSVFENDQRDASASVMVITEPGLRLKATQVRTIRQLVAHAVPGLKPENVTVADASGSILSDDSASPSGDGQSEMDLIRQHYEKQKAKDITELLTPLVGPNNAVVKVNVVMNFDHIESKAKRFIPSGGDESSPTGIPVSVQNRLENYQGTKQSNNSQVGVAGNVPQAIETTSASGNSEPNNQYKNQQVTTNYQVSSEEKHTVEATGKIERLSVAVVINKKLSAAQSQELQALVTSAGGLDTTRGDALSITGMAFSPEVDKANKEALKSLQEGDTNNFIIQLATIGGMFALGFAALFIAYKIISGIGSSLSEPYQVGYGDDDYDPYHAYPDHHGGIGSSMGHNALTAGEGGFNEGIGEGGQQMPSLESMSAGGASSFGPAPALEARLDPEIEKMKSAITGMVENDPADAARLIHHYINEG